MDSCSKQVIERCDPLADKLAALEVENKALREETGTMVGKIKNLKDELVLIKRALAQGNVSIPSIITPTPSRMDVPKPRLYGGARNAKEIDNFLWSLEQCFKALGVDDTKKVDHATLYLADTAMVWWR